MDWRGFLWKSRRTDSNQPLVLQDGKSLCLLFAVSDERQRRYLWQRQLISLDVADVHAKRR
jgi:hypothetical protein